MRRFLFLLVAVLLAALPALAGPRMSAPGLAVDNTTVDLSGAQWHDDDWVECIGIVAKATGPLRYIAYLDNGTSNTVYAPVDTTFMDGAITAGAVAYPVVLTLTADLDSIKFAPTASDTIWYHSLWE